MTLADTAGVAQASMTALDTSADILLPRRLSSRPTRVPVSRVVAPPRRRRSGYSQRQPELRVGQDRAEVGTAHPLDRRQPGDLR